MGFIGTLIDVVVDIVVDIVEAVVQIVEMVVQVIMVLLGFDGGTTQIVEYYEVRNYPLFEDVDKQNPLLQSILQSILANKDISSNLIYHLVYRQCRYLLRLVSCRLLLINNAWPRCINYFHRAELIFATWFWAQRQTWRHR